MKIITKISTFILIKLIVILFTLSLAYGHPAEPRRVIIPDLVIMPISLDEALDASLRTGDGRRVNWQSVRW